MIDFAFEEVLEGTMLITISCTELKEGDQEEAFRVFLGKFHVIVNHVIIDMQRVTLITSVFLNLILKEKRKRRTLKFVGATDDIWQVLVDCQMDKQFDGNFRTLEEALAT